MSDEKIPEAPVARRAREAAAKRKKEAAASGKIPPKKKPRGKVGDKIPKTEKNKAGAGAPYGNSNRNKIDKMTDEEVIDIRDKYYDHLAQGFPITSFHYKLCYKSLQKLMTLRDDIFTEESLEMIKSRRYHTMIEIGMQQAKGTIEKGNAQSWKTLMANMFGWTDKLQTKQDVNIVDEFQKAVLAQSADFQDELELDD